LLRAHRDGPCCYAAEQRDELAPVQLILETAVSDLLPTENRAFSMA
jgi:hypothetical protein